jgi:hypothetical protein
VRILFDENVPLPLRQFFSDDQIATVQDLGWSGIRNGELLDRAEADFDILLLADKNLRYQQNLEGRSLAIVEPLASLGANERSHRGGGACGQGGRLRRG